MEILKHGTLKPKSDSPRHFVCRCDCEFIADSKEYWKIEHFGRVLSYTTFCPDCGALIVMPECLEE